MGHAVSTDAELIDASIAGQVDAFTALVKRYQSLVCAVSYSATGDRALSEDVAQETFVAAWNGLSELREPSKLRAWLSGIARNLSSKALRRVGREIPSDAEVQAAMNDAPAASSPLDDALEKESEQLVWAALRNVPETYREPLVLFYREDQSTKQVAAALGLSENAVQQRLSRGRQHLKAGVADLVERTLERTKPSKGFAAGVIAVISAGVATARMLHIDFDAPALEIDDRFLGDGYAVASEAGVRAVQTSAHLEGILLDQIYAGKAAAGLLHYASSGLLNAGDNVLFIHTGGNAGLFY